MIPNYLKKILEEQEYKISYPLYPENGSTIISIRKGDYDTSFEITPKHANIDTQDMCAVLERTILKDTITWETEDEDGEVQHCLMCDGIYLASVCVYDNEIVDVHADDMSDGSAERCISYVLFTHMEDYADVRVTIANANKEEMKLFAKFGFELDTVLPLGKTYKKKLTHVELEL